MILLSSNVGEEGRKSDINDRVSPRDNVRRVSSPFPLLLRPASCLWMFHTRFYRRRDRLPPSVQRRGDPFNFISPAPPLSCALHPRRREKGAPGPRFTSSLRPSRPRSLLPPSPTRRHTVRAASIAKDREKMTDYLDTYTRTPARFERGIRRDS